jgi:hypothetical protein
MTASQPNPNEPKPAVSEANRSLDGGKLGEAMLWLSTANVLDQSPDRTRLSGAVNSACFAVVAKVVNNCELRLLHCGNVTEKDVAEMNIAREAIAAILSKLPRAGETSKEFENLALVNAHFNRLAGSYPYLFQEHGSLTRFVPTRPNEAADVVKTLNACRSLLAAVQDKADKVETAIGETERYKAVDTAVSNAEASIFGFPFGVLSDFEAATFFIDGAMRLMETPAQPGGRIAKLDKELQELRTALASARAQFVHKNNGESRKELKRALALVRKLGFTTPTGI